MYLIEKVFGTNQTDLIINGDRKAEDAKIVEISTLAERRLKGEPLQYILGSWEFYGYPFKVGKGVLIPRDDTEVLLSVCLEYIKEKFSPKVLDLCSGTGALAIAIAKETNADVTAIEKSETAFSYLTENIALNNAKVNAIQGDIFQCMDMFPNTCFDLILSNPPYIITDEIPTLQKEVSYEPKMALDGGKDGYDFYRHIIRHWSSKLKKGGMMAFELGENQFDIVKELMTAEKFTNIGEKLDLGNIQRVIYGTLTSI